MIDLELHLRSHREQGRKLLVPYITAGVRDDWLELVRAVAEAGADAIEIGLPFSDPVMDGPVIQAASVMALERGMTPQSALESLSACHVEVPMATMTYYNLVFRFGHEAFVAALQKAGISGVILPDLPVEEASDWLKAAEPGGIQTVLLVAPNTTDERLRMLCDRSQGFVYGVSTLGVTGERASLSESAKSIGGRLKAATDKPALLGIGISNPEQAVEAAAFADGVIIGTAVMRRVIEGAPVSEVAEFIASLRTALDA